MDKKTAAKKAADAGDVAAQAVNDYGLGSKEAGGALKAAKKALGKATAAGATPDDIRAARRS